MKRIIILLLLFFAAVAISPLLINEKGYILIAMGNLTIESTVVTATIALVIIFIALLFSLKVFKGGLNFSLGAWKKVVFASRRKAIREFNQGIASYILEDNQQAEHLLSKSAEPSNLAPISYLLAASAADKQGLSANTKHYLAKLNDEQLQLKAHGLASILVTIKLLISHKEYQQARELIDKYHKHIGHDDRLLALEIELSLIENRYDYVVKQLVAARKSKVLEQSKIEKWESLAFTGAFNQCIENKSNQALHDYWNNLPRKVKQREAVLLAYCEILAKHQINQPLTKLLLPVVKKGANESLLKQMRRLPLSSVNDLISATQKHLHHDQHSAKWLSCLAHLAVAANDLSMAEKAFNSLVNLSGEQYDAVDLKAFASVLEKQGQLDKSIHVLNKLIDLTSTSKS